MEFYGIEMKGEFKVEIFNTLPDFIDGDSGRLIYVIDQDKFYYGGNTEWKIPGLNVVATLSELINGTDDVKYISPLKLSQIKASNDDVFTGTDNVKYITSSVLRSLKASIAEANVGADDIKYVTPAGLKSWSDANPGVPTGSVFFFAANTPPIGYFVANGQEVSRTAFASLFAVIGTLYGVGNGSTTFNLPDLRGEFIRGWDAWKGVDPGRGFGTKQTDEFGSHRHNSTIANSLWGANGGNGNYKGDHYEAQNRNTCPNPSYPTQFAGGSETRPKNIALLPCIKY